MTESPTTRADVAYAARFASSIAYKVVAVSCNTNSFGLRGVVLVAKNGEAWEVGANHTFTLKRGDIVLIGNSGFAGQGFEIPRQLPNAPAKLVKKFWPEYRG